MRHGSQQQFQSHTAFTITTTCTPITATIGTQGRLELGGGASVSFIKVVSDRLLEIGSVIQVHLLPRQVHQQILTICAERQVGRRHVAARALFVARRRGAAEVTRCEERYTAWVATIGVRGGSLGRAQGAEASVVYSCVSVQCSDSNLFRSDGVDIDAFTLSSLVQTGPGIGLEVDNDVAAVSRASAGVRFA